MVNAQSTCDFGGGSKCRTRRHTRLAVRLLPCLCCRRKPREREMISRMQEGHSFGPHADHSSRGLKQQFPPMGCERKRRPYRQHILVLLPKFPRKIAIGRVSKLSPRRPRKIAAQMTAKNPSLRPGRCGILLNVFSVSHVDQNDLQRRLPLRATFLRARLSE